MLLVPVYNVLWCAPLLEALLEPISVQKRHTKAENDTVDILGLNWKQPKIEVEYPFFFLFLSHGEYAGEQSAITKQNFIPFFKKNVRTNAPLQFHLTPFFVLKFFSVSFG